MRSPGLSIMMVDSWELPLSAVPLCQLLPCHHAFHEPVCQRLSWLHHWSISHVHTSRTFYPSVWGPDPQCQAGQVVHWIWWWQCLSAWHCRSVWSFPCHFSADVGDLALSMAKSHWHGALRSVHKSCTHGHMSWKRGGGKREQVAAPWTSCRQFSHVLWWVFIRRASNEFPQSELWKYHARLVQVVPFPWGQVRNFNLLVLGQVIHSSG